MRKKKRKRIKTYNESKKLGEQHGLTIRRIKKKKSKDPLWQRITVCFLVTILLLFLILKIYGSLKASLRFRDQLRKLDNLQNK
ncbi:hypothetical protein DIU31_009070 [Mucilaginibacter rubeus]|uniref:Uncharacterized protein n=1 Tax=Mucilaginibacter rubeus TaxID=2027860 RepID=A0AAE6JDE0_9SPHI|nr:MULTISPECIES: hypothetical protein [Mucilaginibacter]QEM03659.1 hypothetical protein DIU31_009070 [Mucilaginibacter rubeus]QEM16270.1 hypothetical protein DIU38_009165 [Mucilaginibacter gossypii]QTE40969.1 hypothetical protein J3L19_18600 [Mucilaginibacter rubeus]QTE47572.1 hypothetical protein J3L21_18575 [Mucilaginibacter rubeus]QTE61577.1 hypothetical protein J3L22_23615 [Mucilaginibacter rubeus]